MAKIKAPFIILVSVIVSLASIIGTIFVLQSTGVIVTDKIALEIKAIEVSDIIYDGNSHTASKIDYNKDLLQNGDVVELLGFSDSIVDVGTIEVTPSVIVKNSKGNDVTSDYKITYVSSSVTVNPRPIEIKPKDVNEIYNASVIKSSDFIISNGSLVSGHVISPTYITEVEDASDEIYQSEITTKILDLRGNDVTSNYQITNSYGQIEVKANTFSVTINSLEKTFDNKGISSNDITYSVTSAYPLKDKKLTAKLEFDDEELDSMKYVGYDYNIGFKNVKFYADNDLIDERNYTALVTEGVLQVNPYKISIITEGKSFEYDGKTHENYSFKYSNEFDDFIKSNNFEVNSIEELESDPTLDPTTIQFVDVGSYLNKFNVCILNSNLENISSNFDISYIFGTITIEKKALKLTSESINVEFDGEAHYSESDSYDEVNGLALGHIIKTEYSLSSNRKYVGTTENVISSSKIFDENGREVTKNYNIEYVNSLITITPRIVEIQSNDVKREYDGNNFELSSTDYQINNGSLVLSKYVISAQTIYSGSKALNRAVSLSEELPNMINIIVFEDDKDISENFTFKFYRGEYIDGNYQCHEEENTYGLIEITPKTVNIVFDDIVKTYDNSSISNVSINGTIEKNIFDSNLNVNGLYQTDYVKYKTFEYTSLASSFVDVTSTEIDSSLLFNIESIVIFNDAHQDVTNNYNFVIKESDKVNITINPYTINSSDIQASDAVYSGYSVEPTLSCKLFDEEINITSHLQATNAGTYYLGVNDLSLANTNYTINSNVSIEFIIKPKAISAKLYEDDLCETEITATSDYAYIYNSLNQSPYIVLVDENGDDVGLTCNSSIKNYMNMIVSNYSSIGSYKAIFELNNSNYFINDNNKVEYDYQIVEKIVEIKLKDNLPEIYSVVTSSNQSTVSKTYDGNVINILDLIDTVNSDETDYLSNLLSVDDDGNKLNILNAGSYSLNFKSKNSNYAFISDSEISIIVNKKDINYTLNTDHENIIIEGNTVFTKLYDGQEIDFTKYITSSDIEYISMDGSAKNYINVNNSSNPYYTINLISNNDNYSLQATNSSLNVQINKIQLKFDTQSSFFTGDDILYDLTSNVQISNSTSYRVVINNNYLTKTNKDSISLKISEIAANKKTKTINSLVVDKLLETNVICVLDSNGRSISNLLGNCSYKYEKNGNETELTATDNMTIISYNMYTTGLIIAPQSYSVTYLDTFVISKNSLKYSCYLEDSSAVPSYLTVSCFNEEFTFDWFGFTDYTSKEFICDIDCTVQIGVYKDGIMYDVTDTVYADITVLDVYAKVTPYSISITTPSASKKYGDEWSTDPFVINSYIPENYLELQDVLVFDNENVSEVGTYTNSLTFVDSELAGLYNVTFSFGTLTITERQSNIIASDSIVSYGSSFSLANYVRCYGDLPAGFNVEDTLLLVDSSNNIVDESEYDSLSAGLYTITANESMLNEEGYSICFYEANLEITPVDVYISTYNQSFQIGDDTKPYYSDFLDSSSSYIQFSSDLGQLLCSNTNALTDLDPYIYISAVDFDNLNQAGYEIYLDYTNDSNYIVHYDNAGVVNYSKCEVTIMVSSLSKVYDGKSYSSDLQALTVPAIQIVSNTYGSANFATDTNVMNCDLINVASDSSDVGDYEITLDFVNYDSKYEVEIVNGVFSITKGTLTITPSQYTKIYDGVAVSETDIESVTYTYNYTGSIPAEIDFNQIKCTLLDTNCVDAGEYLDVISINDYVNSNDNYDVVKNTNSIIITKGMLTITPNQYTKIYDGNEVVNSDIETLSFTKSYNGSNIPSEIDFSDISFTVIYSGCIDVGIYTDAVGILWSLSSNSNFDVVLNTGEIVITKGTLFINPNNYSKAYDEEEVTSADLSGLSYTCTLNGVLYDVTVADLEFEVSPGCIEKGTYNNVISIKSYTLDDSNYNIYLANSSILIY